MIITFDGQSGTGKSTLATLVAQKLGFLCLNTGMIYRAVSYYFLQNNIAPADVDKIENELKDINIEISFIDNQQYVKVNDVDATPFVSSQQVQQNVSLYSQILPLREKVTVKQREFALCNNVVVEGRDIGTHVFPNADYKFFITCDLMVRAKRRYNDLKNLGQDISLQEVVESLKNRDILDSTRKFSPLKKPENAIIIDTSNSSIEECVNLIIGHIAL